MRYPFLDSLILICDRIRSLRTFPTGHRTNVWNRILFGDCSAPGEIFLSYFRKILSCSLVTFSFVILMSTSQILCIEVISGCQQSEPLESGDIAEKIRD